MVGMDMAVVAVMQHAMAQLAALAVAVVVVVHQAALQRVGKGMLVEIQTQTHLVVVAAVVLMQQALLQAMPMEALEALESLQASLEHL